MGYMDCPRCGYPVGRVGDSTGGSAAQDDRDAAVAADRARIAQEIQTEIAACTVHGEDPFAALARLLRVVEGG